MSLGSRRWFANMCAFLAKVFHLYVTTNIKKYCYGYGPSGFYDSAGSLPVSHRVDQALCCRVGIQTESDKRNGVEKTKYVIWKTRLHRPRSIVIRFRKTWKIDVLWRAFGVSFRTFVWISSVSIRARHTVFSAIRLLRKCCKIAISSFGASSRWHPRQSPKSPYPHLYSSVYVGPIEPQDY